MAGAAKSQNPYNVRSLTALKPKGLDLLKNIYIHSAEKLSSRLSEVKQETLEINSYLYDANDDFSHVCSI